MDEAGNFSCPDCRVPEDDGEKRKSHHSEKTINELSARLNRIEGQIRGIRGMIERHVYCDDVLNQIAAAQSALYGVAKLLLEKHMKSCIKEQLAAGREEVIDEVLKTVFKLMR
ncbi:metal-sensitive transcriptional regulator [Desulfotomaculum copahuensis]|uniref:CsoR family transcriptional regulator n=1 Tax=Desulfotomaculum copahuensis TaxID=1838280 RepID=A0A1B7LDD6_9FIRM|nr:metal-sensitive transcriptional regulator [Desulfotomaculum copahuensis]OAT81061.1 CsoR family transcriptional regulator [Desulfotomaculum copahuensis]